MTARSTLGRRSVLKAGAAVACSAYVIPARAAVELKLTHPADVSHPVHIEADKMVRRIAERTNGEVKITLFPNNALGSPVETAQQTRLGAIDMILMNPANIESISKAVGVINIPYQFDGYEHAHHRADLDHAQARRVGDRRARHAGEDHAAQHVHVREPAAHLAHQQVGDREDPLGRAAGVHQVAGEDEEGNREQRKRGGGRERALDEDDQQVGAGRDQHGRGRHHRQRPGDRHAEQYRQAGGEEDAGDQHRGPAGSLERISCGRPPPAWSRRSRCRRRGSCAAPRRPVPSCRGTAPRQDA